MMRNGSEYAVAVRRPDGEIQVEKDTWVSFLDKHKGLNIPFVRGIFNFVDSMRMGMKTLSFSASFYDEEEPVQKNGRVKTEPDSGKARKEEQTDKKDGIIMGITMVFSVILALGIFVMLPMFLSSLFRKHIPSRALMGFIEGLIRLVIFIAYVLLISLMKDIRRVYMYHGAEHKCINCIEHGLPLTVENVRKSSKQHKRCGTSFLLFVVLISILFSMVIQTDTVWLKMLLRILLIPVIAGISYEILRLAGNSDNPIINLISKPGLWLQGLTTREPDDDMIEVGIRSVEAVFDWKNGGNYSGTAQDKGFPGVELFLIDLGEMMEDQADQIAGDDEEDDIKKRSQPIVAQMLEKPLQMRLAHEKRNDGRTGYDEKQDTVGNREPVPFKEVGTGTQPAQVPAQQIKDHEKIQGG